MTARTVCHAPDGSKPAHSQTFSALFPLPSSLPAVTGQARRGKVGRQAWDRRSPAMRWAALCTRSLTRGMSAATRSQGPHHDCPSRASVSATAGESATAAGQSYRKVCHSALKRHPWRR
ncbi:hypothetical protein J2W30_004594 [Variovorax boronicumulans]|nr:hypothetical protein [Variovorax boronicumulans]